MRFPRHHPTLDDTRNGQPALLAGLALAAAVVLFPQPAAAQFADPPDEPIVVEQDHPHYDHPYPAPDDPYVLPGSTLRLLTGPALRLHGDSPDGGLFAALDVGERAAGARLSGTWVRVGSERGLSQYNGELWLDFGAGRRLHPILSAGAGLARLDRPNPETGELEGSTLGVGVLRGGLQYMLPVRGTDARAGIDVTGSIPAIRGEDAADVSPWMTIVASVGVGF